MTVGLVALRVSLDEPCASLCQNLQPHITVAKAGMALLELISHVFILCSSLVHLKTR